MDQPKPQQQSGTRSCCFYGCLFSFLLFVVVVVGGGFAGYWFIKGQVAKFTSDTPSDLPTVEYSEEEVAEIKGRYEEFKESIDKGDTPDDLIFTADEINALIAKNEALRGKFYLSIDEGQVSGELSYPADAVPGGKGRYFNAAATFDVSFEDGLLVVTLASAEMKGEEVPAQFIEAMKKENLAKELNKDPKVAEIFARFESVSVEDDMIVLQPRVKPATEAEATEAEASTAEAEDGTMDEVETNSEIGSEAAPAAP